MSAQNPAPIRVFLISGFHVLLWGLQRLIGSAKRTMTVVGSAPDCDQALGLLGHAMPDVIVLDLDPGNEKGMDGITQLSKVSNGKMLVLTSSRDSALHDGAVLAGARGVAGRETSAETLLTAIEKVHQGQFWVDRAAASRIFVELSRMTAAKADLSVQSKIVALTTREKEIMTALAADAASPAKTIANKLHISEHTLRNHLTSIYEKLGVSSRLALLDYVQKNGTSEYRQPVQGAPHKSTNRDRGKR